ncbi:MAG: hypothetical protein V1866_05055 [archaeon]
MKKIKDIKAVYEECQTDGFIQFRKDVDRFLAESLLRSAKEALVFLKQIELVSEKMDDHSLLFTSTYDILRKLIEAFLLFDRLKCSNHQCANAFLCTKHHGSYFDWGFLEEVRVYRNEVNYEGKRITSDIWRLSKSKFEFHINGLIGLIEKKIQA